MALLIPLGQLANTLCDAEQKSIINLKREDGDVYHLEIEKQQTGYDVNAAAHSRHQCTLTRELAAPANADSNQKTRIYIFTLTRIFKLS